MKRFTKFALLLLIPVIALPAAAQKNDAKTKNNQTSSNAAQAPLQGATNDSSYVIGPTDELNVSVWGQADLSRIVPVRPDGMISLPLINDVQAAGKTPMQLAAIITEKLVTFVKAPQVTVIVAGINSQRVYVLGNVARAGAYPMVPGMTVLQAISSAGGLTLFAKKSKINVLRTENGHQLRLPFSYDDVLRGKKPEQDIVLKSGDTVVVP